MRAIEVLRVSSALDFVFCLLTFPGRRSRAIGYLYKICRERRSRGRGKFKITVMIIVEIDRSNNLVHLILFSQDGRLQAGDQLLKVDGQSLVGITQEK